MVVELALRILGGGPYIPLVFGSDDGAVGLAGEFGCRGPILLEVIEVLEKQDPGGLLHVIQFTPTACVLVQDIVYILKSLFKHGFCLWLLFPKVNILRVVLGAGEGFLVGDYGS